MHSNLINEYIIILWKTVITYYHELKNVCITNTKLNEAQEFVLVINVCFRDLVKFKFSVSDKT